MSENQEISKKVFGGSRKKKMIVMLKFLMGSYLFCMFFDVTGIEISVYLNLEGLWLRRIKSEQIKLFTIESHSCGRWSIHSSVPGFFKCFEHEGVGWKTFGVQTVKKALFSRQGKDHLPLFFLFFFNTGSYRLPTSLTSKKNTEL